LLFGAGRSRALRALVEVRAHVLLQVEVGEHVVARELEQLLKLGVGVDFSAVLAVLQAVRSDVGVDLARDVRPRHLRPLGLLQEVGELVADRRRLDEAAGLPLRSDLPLGVHPLEASELLAPPPLEGLEVVLEGHCLRAERR